MTQTLTDGRPAPAIVRAAAERPVLATVAGAGAIAFSAILVRLAAASPATAAVFRCAYAVPPLWLLARLERRRLGDGPPRRRLVAAAAGAFLAVDLVVWHRAIEAVGAGLATVLANLQVVMVAVVARLWLNERIRSEVVAAIGLSLTGVALISGVLERNAYGDDPVLGVVLGVVTSAAYTGFLLLLRRSGTDPDRTAGPLFDATLSAAVVAGIIGAAVGDLSVVPSWPAHGWLVTLALTAQVLGWLLISVGLPRLSAALTSVLLLAQPACSVALGVVLLGESPTVLQLGGVLLVLSGVAVAGRSGSAVVERAPV